MSQQTENGIEYRFARELQRPRGYPGWRRGTRPAQVERHLAGEQEKSLQQQCRTARMAAMNGDDNAVGRAAGVAAESDSPASTRMTDR
jgi:hypothetical protein